MMTVEFIFSPELDLSKPTDIKKFVDVLGPQNGQLSSIAHLVSGDFADIGALASYIHNKLDCRSQPANSDQPTSNDEAHENNAVDPTKFTYADVLKSRLPQPKVLKASRLPAFTADNVAQRNEFNANDVCLSKKAILRFHRTALNTIGHEKKKFALLRTSAEQPPMQNPFNITRCLAEAGIREPLTLVKSGDPRTFLLFGPESCLPLLQPAYERFYDITTRHCRIQRLPKLIVEPVDDLLSLCAGENATNDLTQLIVKLREEISRLEDKTTIWRPRLYFADALRENEEYCYAHLRQLDPSCDMPPLPPRAIAANRPDSVPTHTERNRQHNIALNRASDPTITEDCHMTPAIRRNNAASRPLSSRSPALSRSDATTNRFTPLQNHPDYIAAPASNVLPSVN
ncbi:hypothetical protein FGB62_25g421 [Gracilaria domingensis]|nr:hypothetical protein FGB62_25g421 [Gracilaria domingensis]